MYLDNCRYIRVYHLRVRFDRGWMMNISSISANFSRQFFVDSQSRLMKSGSEKTKHNQMVDGDVHLNADQENSVASYLLPGLPSMQKQLTSLLPSLDLPVNDNLKRALDLANQFHNRHSIIQPALSIYGTMVQAKIEASQPNSDDTSTQSLNHLFQPINLTEHFDQPVNKQNYPYIDILSGLVDKAPQGNSIIDRLL